LPTPCFPYPASELAVEEEEEEEEEREEPSHRALPESDWNYSAAPAARAASDLRAAAGLERLPNAIAGTLALAPPELARLPWSGRVWCTRNFLRAADLAPGGAANGYLRPPEAALALQRCAAL
jgi:hypothetical protein